MPSPVDEAGLNLLSAPTRVGAGPGLEPRPPGCAPHCSLPPRAAPLCRRTLAPRATTQMTLGTAGHGAEGRRVREEGRAYLVELVESECNSCHDDGQGTVVSPPGTHGACGWERRRVGRRATRVLPQGPRLTGLATATPDRRRLCDPQDAGQPRPQLCPGSRNHLPPSACRVASGVS